MSTVRPSNPPPEHCLLAFEAVVRQGSVADAALELGVSSSALHRSIALLEHLLRCTLFRSLFPKVELTEAGQVYFASVRIFLRHAQEQLAEIQASARVDLRVGSCAAIARLCLVPRLAAFRDQIPQADLELCITTLEQQATWSTHFDAVLWYGFRPNTLGHVQVLWPGNAVSYAAPRVRLRSDLPRICWSPGETAAAQSEGGQFVVVSDLMVALEMALAGVGSVDCPRELTARYVRAGRLVPISAVVSDPRALYLVHGDTRSSALAGQVTQWLVQSAQALRNVT